MPPTSPVLNESTFAVCAALLLLAPLAAAGIALMNTGLGRSRSAAHAMLSALCVFGVGAIVFVVVGFALLSFPGRTAISVAIGGKAWGLVGADAIFLRGIALDGSPVSLAVLFEIMAAGVVALIPLGGTADRWRLGAACLSTAILTGITYPVFAHWAWGGGWLSKLGTNYSLGAGFVDCGGAAAIHVTGGLTALALAWILGPRRGKYSPEGMPAAIPGHNAVLVMFSCMLSLIGWFGLNGAGAILFQNAPAGRLVQVAVSTLLSACAAALAAAAITRVRFGRPDASLCANGWVGGLVASSAGCAFLPPSLAILTGLVAGVLVPLSVEWLELHLSVDDPGGAVSVHGAAGIWGLMAAGMFSHFAGQWVAQLIGVATLVGFVLPLTFGLNFCLDRVFPQRVAPEGERQGMDLFELGAGAYPEFPTHTDDFLR